MIWMWDCGTAVGSDAGIFSIRLEPEDWTSGENNWLLDVIAQDQLATGRVIGNIRQVVEDGELRMHPIIRRLVYK